MFNEINNYLKNYVFHLEKERLNLKIIPFEYNPFNNYGIDAGVKGFTHPFLKGLGVYLINLVAVKNNSPIESAQMIIFCNDSDLRSDSIKFCFEKYSFLNSYCKYIGYSVSELIENFFNVSRLDDLLSRIRNFAEISMYYHILNICEKESVVLRDGLFYFPYEFPGFEKLGDLLYNNKEKVFSISKSSLILKDPKVTKNIDFDLDKSFYTFIDESKYYEKYKFDFLKNYIVRFNKRKGSKELYHVQCYDPEIISKIRIGNTFHYPISLYVADKFSHLDDSELKTMEIKLIQENYPELSKIYKSMYKYQRERLNGPEF